MIVPEDQKNNDLINGFINGSRFDVRQIQVMPIAGGWSKAADSVETLNLAERANRHVLLVIDFDDNLEKRRKEIDKRLTKFLDEAQRKRVYLLDTRNIPEDFRSALHMSAEQVGAKLSLECEDPQSHFWQGALFEHNFDERTRLIAEVLPLLTSL